MHISTLDANAEAIGTGKVATPDQAEETQAAIRAYIKEAVSAEVADKVPWCPGDGLLKRLRSPKSGIKSCTKLWL